MKKYFIFTDVHGNLSPLIEALEEKGFEIENENHHLISLGDNFDRGNQNLAVLGFLKYFFVRNRIVLIKGNHDDNLLNFLLKKDNGVFNIKNNGMGNTLIEFSSKESNTIDKIREAILTTKPYLLDMLNSMVDEYKIGNYVFTHAGYSKEDNGAWKVNNFSDIGYFINHFETNGNTYVFGHLYSIKLNKYFKSIDSNEAFRFKGFIGLDAMTNSTKKVNILIIDDNGNEK